jgi:ribosome-binding protein aMBF1 (putative translation factor)
MSIPQPAPTALTAAQCRAGRALIEWSQAQLSQSAAIDLQTIADFERRVRSADETTRRRLRATLEAAGVMFISENGAAPAHASSSAARKSGK